MTAEESAPGTPSDTGTQTPSPMVWRLAVGPNGDHGYEVGYWPANANLNDPSEFIVIEGVYGQQEAAQRAAVLNQSHMTGEAPAPLRDEETRSDDDGDDEEAAPHRRSTRHRK